MKTRNGFVSNSSTTSFFCFGIPIENEEEMMNKLLGKIVEKKIPACAHEFNREKAKFSPECGAKAWIIEDTEHKIYEIEEPLKKMGLSLISGVSDGEYYIGFKLNNDSAKKASPIKKIRKLAESVEFFKKEFNAIPDFYCGAGFEESIEYIKHNWFTSEATKDINEKIIEVSKENDIEACTS